MEIFGYKRKGIKYKQIWFNTAFSIEPHETDADILEFRESYHELKGLYPFNDGTIDLHKPLTEIFEKFDKGFKYEVRRAEKENLTCAVLVNIDPGLLRSIFDQFNIFCESKNIPVIAFEFLQLYHAHHMLEISVARLDEIALQYHIYFVSEQECILLASFPSLNANVKKNLIGFANRLLHWFDIQNAHNRQKKIYNLGGIGNSGLADTQGIVKFKLEMSPDSKTYYHGIIPVTLKGKIFLKAKALIKKYVE
jgi:hypothetical protein